MECTVIVLEIRYSIMVVQRCQSDIIMYFCMSGCSVTFGSYNLKIKLLILKLSMKMIFHLCVEADREYI